MRCAALDTIVTRIAGSRTVAAQASSFDADNRSVSDVSLTVDDRSDVEPPRPGVPDGAGAAPPRPFLPRLPAATPRRVDGASPADLTPAATEPVAAAPAAVGTAAVAAAAAPAPMLAPMPAPMTTTTASVLPPPLPPPPSVAAPPVPVMPPLSPVPADPAPTTTSVPPPPPWSSHQTDAVAAPAPDAPSPAADQVDEDLLARKAAESGDPHLLAAAQHFAQQRSAKALPQVKGRRTKRSRRRWPFLAAFVLVAGGAGMLTIGKDTTVMQRLRGDGYDPDALPGTVFARPTTGGVTYEWTTERVTVEAGAARIDTIDSTITLDLATGDRSLAAISTITALTDGGPGDAVTLRELEMVDAPSGTFVRDAGGAWGPHVPGSFPADDAGAWTQIWMYQDLVDPSLRTTAPSSVRASLDGALELTTYTWELERDEWFEAAPQLRAQLWRFDEPTGDTLVEIELTVDAAGVVRELVVTSTLDDALAAAGDDGSAGYREHWTLVEWSDDAPEIVDPGSPTETAEEG